MCALFGAGAAAANAHGADDSVATPEDLRLSFTDAAGEPALAPYFNVAGAYPGMKRQVATATLANHGPIVIGYDLSIRVAGASTLGDVLVAAVSRQGHIVYHGPLSQLRVESPPPLAPDSSVSYRIELSWPDGGSSDNQYQGTSLRFDLLARSRQAFVTAPGE